MSILRNAIWGGVLASGLTACGVTDSGTQLADTGVTPGTGGTPATDAAVGSGGNPATDAAVVSPDGAVVVADAAVLPPDAVVLPPDAAVLPPDAVVLPPDAAVLPPDAAVLPPDAAVVFPDAAVVFPDAAVVFPDAAPPEPDAAPPEPDAAPPEPDAAPLPVYACGNIPVEDLFPLLVPGAPDNWSLMGNLPANGPSNIVGTCGGGGAEHVFGVTIPADGVWRFDTLGAETDFDTVLYLMSSCPTQPDGVQLRCNDDTSAFASGLLYEAHAGDVLYLVVDDYGHTGGNYRLNAVRLPAVERGGICDAFSATNACRNGDYCFAVNVPGQPPTTEGSCISASDPPAITGITALRSGDGVGLTIDGADVNGDASGEYIIELLAGQRAQIVDNATGSTEATLMARQNTLGELNFRISDVLAVYTNWPNTTAIRVRLKDGAGNVSVSTTAQIGAQPVRNAGQPCDPARALDLCALGLGCIDADGLAGPAAPACAVNHAPVITAATITHNINTAAVSITVTGTDADRDVNRLVVGFFSAAGALIDPPGAQTFAAESVSYVGNTYTAQLRLRLGAAEAGFATMALLAADATDLTSAQFNVQQFAQPVVVNRAQTCDLFYQSRDLCTAGTLCYSPNYGAFDGTCQAANPVCPDDWHAGNLNNFPVGNGWRVSGSLAVARSLTTASCANMAVQDVYAFTAPRAGTYEFRTESDEAGADTALFVRSYCRYSDVAAELVCNDDIGPGNFLSDTTVDLGPAETVYVFVGGVNTNAFPKGSWRGRYRLVAGQR